MTILQICAVYDIAVQAYVRPMFVPHTGAAVRGFRDEVNRKEQGNSLAAHPEDYELHLLGHWDDETGRFENQPSEVDVVLLRGKDAQSLS